MFIINNSNLEKHTDTSVLDMPSAKLYSKTYITIVTDNYELKKYVNAVVSVSEYDGVKSKVDGTNTFYFHKNKLIKVEEYLIEGEKRQDADWYYWNEKPLYYTLKSDKSEERIKFLLSLSKIILKDAQSKVPVKMTL